MDGVSPRAVQAPLDLVQYLVRSAECRGQHSRQPQVQGLRVAFPLCGVDLWNLEILVLINKSTEDFWAY